MTRSDQLLADVVAQFERGKPVMAAPWRIERAVRPGEAEHLAGTCAAVPRGHLTSPSAERRHAFHLILSQSTPIMKQIIICIALACAASTYGKTLVIESSKVGTGTRVEHRTELARVTILSDGTPNRLRSVTEESFPKCESEPNTAGGGKSVTTLVPYWFGTEVTARQLPSGSIEVTLEHRQLDRTHTESDGTVTPEYTRGGFTAIVAAGESSRERLVDDLLIRVRVEDDAKAAIAEHASSAREAVSALKSLQQTDSPDGIDWNPAIAPVATR